MRICFISFAKARFLRPVSLGLASLMLNGCFYANTSQAPIATTYPYTEQQRMQAAQHWEVLAQNEASGILRSERVRFRDLHIPAGESSHLSAYSGGEFERGFRTLLTSELVSRGGNVTTQPHAGSAIVQVNVEVVEHRGRGYTRPPLGAYTALATGVAVASLPLRNWSEPALALIPAAMLADTTSGSWTHTGNEEIIVTTQIVEDNRILYSSSNIYYINAGDRRHYAPHRVPQAPATPTVSITDTW
ncbi:MULTISPECIES: hypothetical protein [unclassified Halomonas]|uniref:hypothetical protein n=1 Tax=unclassified Halomonas TaxID=2609666 RepID=UPI0009904084|nr:MULTISPECIES: hypothetical protein [unclassified Halomonas]AQU83034.1 hypothetical protein B2G49_10700 [Halomonas sp. 'Soap Lake \